jgi:hypothetical protein
MHARLALAGVALSAALAFAAFPAAAGTFSCEDASLSVTAEARETAELACRLAAEAKARIGTCGLAQARPVRIELVAELEHALGACLGSFDCDAGLIRVVDPAHLAEAVGPEPPYALFPAEVLFGALIAHELAHALLEQSSLGIELAFVDHEYVAAVMELETMAPAWREVYIAAAPVGLPPRVGLISALIYGFEPRKFAVNAWQFFRAEPDGCDRIRRIAAGTFTFADLPR